MKSGTVDERNPFARCEASHAGFHGSVDEVLLCRIAWVSMCYNKRKHGVDTLKGFLQLLRDPVVHFGPLHIRFGRVRRGILGMSVLVRHTGRYLDLPFGTEPEHHAHFRAK